jgi:hypothetical protein
MAEQRLVRLGRIVRLQVQRSKLKLGEKPRRVYDPAPLLSVGALRLTRAGALGVLPDGTVVMDVHHAGHPETRNNDGANDLSVGFTGHYAAMRAAYGPHLADGCAGENILVEAEGEVALARVARGLVIRGADQRGREAALTGVRVALPCVEFSGYASRTTEAGPIKAALQFLGEGRRGFYCGYESEDEATVTVGDEVWVGG